MASSYSGHYPFNTLSISLSAPRQIGVYYCGSLNAAGELIPHYIGRAIGEGVDIYCRIIDHLNNKSWRDVTHFGYIICSTPTEAQQLEIAEIRRCQPKYNTHHTGNTNIFANRL